MMKWKVIKNPRSSSADRSLECLSDDAQQPQLKNNGNDSNNNVGGNEESKQDSSPQVKEANKQRDSSLVRKSPVATIECINLRSILGLTRQRSETNLSSLGLISTEPRRCRSEVRGVSCERLTVGYHTTLPKPIENGQTRSSSPPSKSGCWLRGRKRERESRNPKNNHDIFGKTVVAGSCTKRTSSKTRNGDSRTIVDGSDSREIGKICSTKPLEPRKGKNSKRSGEEDIIEEEVIYAEIGHDNICDKLLEENKEPYKVPNKVIRKKGLAPKPQVSIELFKDVGRDVHLNPNGLKTNGSITSLNKMLPLPANLKQSRKNQTFNCRNLERKNENRAIQSVKINNLKNNEKVLCKTRNKLNAPSTIEVAEVHNEKTSLIPEAKNKIEVPYEESPQNADINKENKVILNNKNTFMEVSDTLKKDQEEPFPFHIDTPDYSTLDSVTYNSYSLSVDDTSFSKADVVNCNPDCDESINESSDLITPGNGTFAREISLSSILRDSSNEYKGVELETKKSVRFEKLDLIEKYKRNKTESLTDAENDVDVSVTDVSKPLLSVFDIDSNETVPPNNKSFPEDTAQSDETQISESPTETEPPKDLTVNVLIRNPSPEPQIQVSAINGESSHEFIVKKSFVLTVAKQEKGFRSLCANKKPEVPTERTKNEHQISVTFLCSGPPSESWVSLTPGENQRLRSTSVPPRSYQAIEIGPAVPATRGRSRERRSKERQHCKKNHKVKKKDAVFVMPQAVIDELSQVLEKRKPSLDEIPVHP